MKKLKVLDLFSGYTIREDGEITSRFGRIVKQHVSANGYVRVELWSAGAGKKYLLHRLLAQAFLPNPERKPQVNHIDGNKLNNRLNNLEWATQRENQLHAYRNGLQKGFRKSCPLSEEHKKALCGSRWRGEARVYRTPLGDFRSPEEAASANSISRQSVYNRAASDKFPNWKIEIKEVRANG